MRGSVRNVSRVGSLLAAAVLLAAPWTGALAAMLGTGTATVGGNPTTVLTGPGGHTLYYFTADRPGHPGCVGRCLKFWPPFVVGEKLPAAPAGVTGQFGRTDGGQLTYQGHPLYTFVRDGAPGQAKGEGIHSFGGAWWVATPKLAAAAAAPVKSSSSW